MDDQDQKREELIRIIEAAFADVEYPGDNKIGRRPEVDAIVGTDWRSVTVRQIRIAGNELHFFYEEGLLYYLPAFLIALVTYTSAELDVFTEVFWQHVTPGGLHAETTQRLKETIKLMTPAQKRAVYTFFEFYLDSTAPALNTELEYWLESGLTFWSEQLET